MRFLAAYIMRGQLQAITAVTVCAVLALVLMPMSWPIGYLSAAGVGLVTLVQGAAEGGKTLLGATVLQAVIGMLVIGSPALALSFALSLWLPAWILAILTLYSRSLVVPLQALLVMGLVAVLAVYLMMGDPAAWWYAHVVKDIMPTLQKANMDFPRGPEVKQWLVATTKLMTGALVMFTAWGVLAGLLIARWWQAVLYRPGAFGAEFRALSLGKVIALLGVVLLLLAMLAKGRLGELANNLLLVMNGVLVLQGLAVAHALVLRFKAHYLWLVVLYVMLMTPYMLTMVAMTGLIDNWVDFRKRFQARA